MYRRVRTASVERMDERRILTQRSAGVKTAVVVLVVVHPKANRTALQVGCRKVR